MLVGVVVVIKRLHNKPITKQQAVSRNKDTLAKWGTGFRNIIQQHSHFEIVWDARLRKASLFIVPVSCFCCWFIVYWINNDQRPDHRLLCSFSPCLQKIYANGFVSSPISTPSSQSLNALVIELKTLLNKINTLKIIDKLQQLKRNTQMEMQKTIVEDSTKPSSKPLSKSWSTPLFRNCNKF